MMFLLRTAFWTSLLLALLPSLVPGKSGVANPVEVGPTEAVTAASATVADLGGLCDRQPEACLTGAELIAAYGHRVQLGARIVYEFVGKELAGADRVHPSPTGGGAESTTAVQLQLATPKSTNESGASQQTLTAADLVTPWRGPPPHRETLKRPI